MIRSVRNVWRSPPCSIGGSRSTSASNARGQSSSVPSSRPIRCSDKAWQMVGDLGAPCGPVVWGIFTPDVELVPNPLPREHLREARRLLERAGRVLPHAAADGEQQRHV